MTRLLRISSYVRKAPVRQSLIGNGIHQQFRNELKPRVRVPAGRREVRETIEAETARFSKDEQEHLRMVW